MRARTLQFVLLGLLLAASLPLVGDAGIAVPTASQAACCNVADAPPPPAPAGDEDFFSTGGGGANIMALLDTSGSMQELPKPVVYPTNWPGSNGTCTGTSLNAFTSKRKTDPYDNGYVTYSDPPTNSVVYLRDDPPWGKAKCEAKQAAPATDNARDYCLFRGTSYYKLYGTDLQGFWARGSDNDAQVYNANPCAVVDGEGRVVRAGADMTVNNGRVEINTNGAGAVLTASNAAECRTCLDTVGYYMFRVTVDGQTWNQTAFKGDFLNGYPPKYIAARKVLKDIVKIDPSTPIPKDSVRFGLTTFAATSSGGFSTNTTGLRAGDGGALVVPLGPNCDQVVATDTATRSGHFKTARQAIIDAVNAADATTNAGTYVTFSNFTALAESLFNVGQYFSNGGAGGLYTNFFGSTWVRSSFSENQGGTIGASWTGTGKNQKSFCFACQQASVVVITDGAPNRDSNLPSSAATAAHANLKMTTGNYDFRWWQNPTIDCPACKCDLSYGGTGCTSLSPSSTRVPNMMHKVAYFLAQTDMRPDLVDVPKAQTVTTYTVSFGLDDATNAASAAAVATLQKTAALGGGIFNNSNSGDDLAAAVQAAVSDVVDRATSFSSASANGLQTARTTNADAYLGRFRPFTSTPLWEGHLFAGAIFDEFGQGCDSRYSNANQKLVSCGTATGVNPNIDLTVEKDAAGDDIPNGKATCGSAYVVDQDCDPIIEDTVGGFKKGDFDSTTHALLSTPDDANMFWDAGYTLSNPTLKDGTTPTPGYRSANEEAANKRTIYTVIDVNADGKLTAADGLVEFTADNAAALAPMMNLPLTSTGLTPATAWNCTKFLQDAAVCGNAPLDACPASPTDLRTMCAAQIIHYIRGWDVLDGDADFCGGPDNYYNEKEWSTCTNNANCGPLGECSGGKCRHPTGTCNATSSGGEERDRSNDSRSSSAQEFWKLGDIFHSSPVVVKPPVDKVLCNYGYDTQCLLTLYSAIGQSASATTPLERTGVLDAYDIWRKANLDRQRIILVGANDGMLHAFNAGKAKTSAAPNPDGSHPVDNGDGEEVWGFIPPDQLPRLRYALTEHTYFVDGTAMVRDIWVDANKDGTKQSTEYHTVAIITERGGGSRFTALDVSNPAAPAFLWTFPQVCSPDSTLTGQTWSEFLPRPPPIGPIRLALPAGSPQDPLARGYEERWIAFLNGGYDPTLVRGRGVFMVDAWTGGVLWRYTDADFKAMRGDTAASMFPIAATIGMSDIGKADRTSGTYDNDGYFDTATFGDVAGNLFTARFYDPGLVDNATGLVTDAVDPSTRASVGMWSVARSFESNRQADNSMKVTGRAEFYQMTANIQDGPGRLNAYLGSVHRARLMPPSAGLKAPTCGADNVLECCTQGCTVTSAVQARSFGAGSCTTGGTFQCSGGNLTYTPSAATGCTSAFSCNAYDNKVDLTFSCGAAGNIAASARLICAGDGTCTTDQTITTDNEISISTLAATPVQHRFYSVWAYGGAPSRLFSDAAGAKAFDAQRLTDVTYAGCTAVPGGSCKLVETSPALVQASGGGLVTTCQGGATKCAAVNTDPGWMYSYGKYCPMGPGNCTPAATWTDESTGSQPNAFLGCVFWSGFRPTGSVTVASDPCGSTSGNPTSISYYADAKTGAPRKNCGVGEYTGSTLDYVQRGSQKNALAPPQAPLVRVVMNDKGQVNYSTLRIDAGSPADKGSLGTRSSASEPLYWLEVPRVVHTCRHVDPTTCE